MIPDPGRVLQVCAVWEGPGARLHFLRIVPEKPPSETDSAVLGLARALAHGILTSAANLRAEAGLEHGVPPGLEELRERVRGPGAAGPASAVLTRSGDVDLGHRLFADPGDRRVLTGREGAEHLASRASDTGLRIEALPRIGPRAAVRHLQIRLGWQPLCIELGPRSSRPLYRSPVLVDSLWLSTYLGPEPAEPARGGAFLSRDEIAELFGPAVACEERMEAGAPWRFERFERRDPQAGSLNGRSGTGRPERPGRPDRR